MLRLSSTVVLDRRLPCPRRLAAGFLWGGMAIKDHSLVGLGASGCWFNLGPSLLPFFGHSRLACEPGLGFNEPGSASGVLCKSGLNAGAAYLGVISGEAGATGQQIAPAASLRISVLPGISGHEARSPDCRKVGWWPTGARSLVTFVGVSWRTDRDSELAWSKRIRLEGGCRAFQEARIPPFISWPSSDGSAASRPFPGSA